MHLVNTHAESGSMPLFSIKSLSYSRGGKIEVDIDFRVSGRCLALIKHSQSAASIARTAPRVALVRPEEDHPPRNNCMTKALIRP
jgi:hypothetical protein